jgi:aminopeptidase N
VKRFLLPLAALAALALLPAAASAQSPGATSLGDPLFPQIGNGGYDVGHYDLYLDYEPVGNLFEPGTQTVIDATATQDLSRFSLDFQRDLAISSVKVDGVPASFTRHAAKPRLSRDAKVSQPGKLVVTPATPIADGAAFTVTVSYSGTPQEIVDIDHSVEGWVHACSKPGSCEGSFTVNEPIGAQSWFPCNNYPSDKATFTIAVRAPNSYTALGTGELAGKHDNGDGTTTWEWNEDDPTATYLTTATVGRYDLQQSSMLERATGVTLPVYTAIDTSAPGGTQTQARQAFSKIPAMTNFISKRFGPYPFDSVGGVAGWVPAVGYALENQTKPHFAGNENGLDVPIVDLAHELAHQWTGDSVSARTWQQIWFNEGMATFTEVFWDAKANGSKLTPRKFFNEVYDSSPGNFRLAPANLRSPKNLFDGWAVYNRPGAMFEGFREIVGNERFFRFTRRVMADHAYSTIGERQVLQAAKDASRFHGKRRKRLGRYFRQWLHREGVPKLTPADFR